MKLPLGGRRIVITRSEPENGPLATALRRAGAEPLIVPVVGLVPVADDVVGSSCAIREFDWITFTSANGARMFWARLDAAERAAFRAHRGIAAVGPATTRAVAALGATAALTAPEFVAESLADALGNVVGKRILWPRAAGARSVLADVLRKRDADVVERILYDTVALPIPAATADRLRDADAVTFTSPSSVRAFVASLGAAVVPRVVCIGPVTAAAATDAGLIVSAVAKIYTLEGLVTALSDMFALETTLERSAATPLLRKQ